MSGRDALFGKKLLIAGFLFLSFFCAGTYCSAQDGGRRTVEVEGTGKVVNDDFARGRDEAIRDALCRAVEEAAAVWLPSGLPVQKTQEIKNALDQRAESYVQDFRIISEKPSKNLYAVVVRVTVSAGDIKKDLQSLGFLKAQLTGSATVPVLMTIRGLASYGDYARFKELLTRLASVKSVSERQIEWRTVRVELHITGTAKSLAAELAGKSVLPLEIRKVDRDSVEIAVLN